MARISGPARVASSTQAGTVSAMSRPIARAKASARPFPESATREKPANDIRCTACEMLLTGQLEMLKASWYRPSMAGPSVWPTIAESTLTTPSVSRLAPARGRPNCSSWRACAVFQPGLMKCGAATVATSIAAVQPAREPHAKLIAPCPEKASQIVTPVLITKLTESTTIRRPWANSLVSSASGTLASPSMITQTHRMRSMCVAFGEPSRRATDGAAAYMPTYITVLAATDNVNTVRAKLRMSPSHRMIAALTPSSFALSRIARTICDTAYRPYTLGPNTVRASMAPTAKLLTRTTIVFSRLHCAPERTLLSRSRAAGSADGWSTRARSGEAIG